MLLQALVYIGVGGLIASFGRDRKLGFWGYFLCSVFLTPLMGLLLVLASDRKSVPSR